jgi:protein translocase SecG subunit
MDILMYVAYTVYVVAAVFMIGAILLQEGKGGGLSALGGTQAESAFGASNPIRRMTVVLAVLFFLLAGFLSFMSSRESLSPGTEQPTTEEAPQPDETPGDTTTLEGAPAEAKGEPTAPAPAKGDETKTDAADVPAATANE